MRHRTDVGDEDFSLVSGLQTKASHYVSYIFNYMCMPCAGMCTCKFKCLWNPEEGIRFHGSGIKGSWEAQNIAGRILNFRKRASDLKHWVISLAPKKDYNNEQNLIFIQYHDLGILVQRWGCWVLKVAIEQYIDRRGVGHCASASFTFNEINICFSFKQSRENELSWSYWLASTPWQVQL